MFEKAQRGENIGKAPYGYRSEYGKLIVDFEQGQIVKLIFELYQTGSLSSVCRYLNNNCVALGYKSAWSMSTIRYILENPVYIGFLRYNYRKKGQRKFQNNPSEWIITKGAHEPLVSPELFAATKERLMLFEGNTPRVFCDKNIRHWAQHLVKCEICGRVMNINSCGGGKYTAYRCTGANLGVCSGKSLSTRKLDLILKNKMHNHFKKPSAFVFEYTNNDKCGVLLNMLNASLNKLTTKFNLAKKAYLSHVDTLDEYKQNKEQLIKEKADILRAIEDIKSKASAENDSLSTIQVENFLDLLENPQFSIDEKNKAAKQIIKEIQLNLNTKNARLIYFF